MSRRAPIWCGIFGLALGVAFIVAACYATTGVDGSDPTAYPMPNDNAVTPLARKDGGR